MGGVSSLSGPPLRVVLVHWNQPLECGATVKRLAAGDQPVRITVVDNCSRPGDRAELDRQLADAGQGLDLEVLDASGNLGFGPGANLGLRRFLERPDDGEWVALMPHDVGLPVETLPGMLATASAVPTAGLCCADVGDGMAPVIDPYFGGMVVPGGTVPGWEPVDFPHGTLMLLRRGCLAEVGVFDERYFSYCEEADLSLRARRAGWEVGLVRGAMVRNIGLGSSVWLVDYLQTRNTLLLVQEMSGWYHAFIRVCFTLAQVVQGLRDPATRPPVFDAGARWAGVRDFTLRRFGPPPAARR